MKEPTSPEELSQFHQILRTNPQRYIGISNEWIRKNPNNAHAYFSRHLGWMEVGEPRRALADLDQVLKLNPDVITHFARGKIHRYLGEYEKALEDFSRGEAIDRKQWDGHAVGQLYQADCYARLGNEAAALSSCARLPEDFWTPGLQGTPAGDKQEIADELCRIAAAARHKG